MKNRAEFQVNAPCAYDAYPLTAADAEPVEAKRHLFRQLIEQPPEAKPKTAVWVVHGMGQQVPFATLEQVAEGIILAAGDENVSSLRYREVQVGKTVLQRAELTVNLNGTPREVDVYECYWAPKTEGAVKLRNVIAFLWDGGSRGLINFFSGFQRALFGTMAEFTLSWRTPTFLLITLLVLAALMAINAIIVATSASIAKIGKFPDPEMVQPLTVLAGLVSAAAITFGVVLFIAESSKPVRSQSIWGKTIRNLTWFGVAFTILTVVTGAALMALVFWGRLDISWLKASAPRLQALANVLIFSGLALAAVSRMWRRRQVSRAEAPWSGWFSQALFYLAFLIHLAVVTGAVLIVLAALHGHFGASPIGKFLEAVRLRLLNTLTCLLGPNLGGTFYGWLVRFFRWPAWVWPFLVLISGVVRKLMVEYVGDVTAYVASNKVDCFDELRAKIKALAKESLGAVYSAKPKDNDQFEYGRVCVVGHSLGSVIAYDTLNRLIADDSLTGNPARVVDRTGLLLTFGSPLDKTAFFFSILGKTTRHIREQLAAVVQPLIEDRSVRDKIEWINVYSRNDIVSGSLDFYQFPDPPPGGVPQVRKVVNVKDPDALIPLVAHVEYWSNPTVWTALLHRL